MARAAASVTTQEHYGDARHDTQADENPEWNYFREVPWMMKTGFQHLCDLWKAHLTRDRHLRVEEACVNYTSDVVHIGKGLNLVESGEHCRRV